MDESASTVPLKSPDESARSSWSTWLLMIVIGTAALALIAAHAPARIRLLGLFFVAFGVLVGWGATKLLGVLDVRLSTWGVAVTASLLTVFGLIGSTLETIRLERVAQGQMSVKDKLQVELQNNGLPIMQDKAGAKSSQDAVQWSVPAQTTFSSYLARRTKPLGGWNAPYPAVLWSCEILAAAIASAWTALALSKNSTLPVSPDSSVKA